MNIFKTNISNSYIHYVFTHKYIGLINIWHRDKMIVYSLEPISRGSRCVLGSKLCYMPFFMLVNNGPQANRFVKIIFLMVLSIDIRIILLDMKLAVCLHQLCSKASCSRAVSWDLLVTWKAERLTDTSVKDWYKVSHSFPIIHPLYPHISRIFL